MRHHATAAAAMAVSLCLLALSAASAAAAPPTISGTTFSEVTTSSATLEAEINPGGKPTLYHFEYGPADCTANPCTSTPNGKISAGSASVPAEAEIKGLTPDTTYHFLVVAENSEGKPKGPDRTFATYALEAPLRPCANEVPFRGGPSAHLPDCRAYEQASPAEKNGADINGGSEQVQAASGGGAVTFFSAAGLPGSVGAQDFSTYLARRGDANWSTAGVYPPPSAGAVARNAGWTPDLAQFFSTAADSFAGPFTFRARASADDSFTVIHPGSSRLSFLAGASTDGSKVFFQNDGQLDPATAAGTNDLYVWDRGSGTVSLAGVLPDSACGSPPCIPPGGSFAGPYNWFQGTNVTTLKQGGPQTIGALLYYVQDEHAVSNDGSRAYFTAGGSGQIYLRKNATGPGASTVQVSASEKTNGNGPGGSDANGSRPAAFLAATPDGSAAFFTSPEKLTNDANTGPEPAAPRIARAAIGGSPASIEADFLPATASGVAVAGEHIYWADPATETIGRAKLNGAGAPSEVKDDFISEEVGHPQYVAVDGAHVYWTNSGPEGKEGEGTIGRANLDGSEPKEDFIAGANNPQGIAVSESKIYWANTTSFSGDIGRADIGGNPASVEQNFIHTLGENPQGIAVDGEHIFWTSITGKDGFVFRRDLNGNPASELFIISGVNSKPQGIAIDGGHVYWARRGAGTIGRAPLDFSSPELAFISAPGNLKGLALDGEHIYWSANGEAVPNPGNDLYRYDVGGTKHLSDLTSDSNPGDVNGAEVKGILGASADGSYLYFAANGDLDGSGPATGGNCQGTGNHDFLSFSGSCSLYLAHAGTRSLIARLDATGGSFSDAADWEPAGTALGASVNTARVSADGQTLVFRSQRRLGAYDNEGVPEFYRYQAGGGPPSCISCNPSGAAPVAAPSVQSIEPFLNVVNPPGKPPFMTRNLSADGKRFFFESADKLVAADTNGEEGCAGAGQASVPSCQDVYEWEAEGTGSCESAAANGGCLYLLSTGSGSEPSFFGDASATGDDAFIFSREALVPQDRDQLQDVYDVRADGGLISQYPPPEQICEGEAACKPGAKAPPGPEPCGSACFSGPANPKAKRPHHPKKPRHHKKQHKKGKARHGRSAQAAGRASR